MTKVRRLSGDGCERPVGSGSRFRPFASILIVVCRPLVRRSAKQILEGRLLDPDHPERGRWQPRDVSACLDDVWKRVETLLTAARLDELPTYGSRLNVFLAVVTTAAYEVLLDRGVSRPYAISLTADIGWKIYAWMLRVAALPARLSTRDSHKRVERTLRALMVFPFSSTGAPGYAVTAWSEGDRFYTHWTHCPPQTFVRRLVQEQGDRGELDAFYRSWCLYDWPGADLIAGDTGASHYARPHTMSRGDAVCDMCWWGGSNAPRSGRGGFPSSGARGDDRGGGKDPGRQRAATVRARTALNDGGACAERTPRGVDGGAPRRP